MFRATHPLDSDPHHKLSLRSITNLEITPRFGQQNQSIQQPQTPCTKDYEFMLLNLDSSCYYTDVIANFKPVFDPTTNQFKKIYPHYNLDHHHWSPAFILEAQSRVDAMWESKFAERVKQANENSMENSKQLKIPTKIGATQCRVCGCKFENYQSHIREIKHKKAVKRSMGEKYITKLIRNFQKELKRKQKDKENLPEKLTKTTQKKKPVNKAQPNTKIYINLRRARKQH